MPGVGGWLTVETFASSFSIKAFPCKPKKRLPLRKVPTPSAGPRGASLYAEKHGKGAEKPQPVHFCMLCIREICEPLQVRKRIGFGETTFPAGASPKVRDELLGTAKWGA